MNFNASKIAILLAAAFMASLFTMSDVQAAPGDLDPAFGNGGKVFIFGNTIPRRVRVQPDGKIVTLGDYAYASYAFISRNNPDGTPDFTFSGGLIFLRQFEDETEFFSDFIFLPDGKYLLTGWKDGQSALFRYTSYGTRDTSFGNNGVLTDSFSGGAVALQPDGRVIIGGYNEINGVWTGFLVRYNLDGKLDADFGEAGMVLTDGGADKIVIQPDGKFLVRSPTNHDSYQITRYNSNGTRDNNFGTNGVVNPGVVSGIGLQSTGKIIFGGGVGQNLSRLERYNENGTLDTSFGINGRVDITDTSNLGVVRSIAVQRNNKIVTAGSVNDVFAIYRFDPNGSPDATFGTNGLVTTEVSPTCRLFDITLQPDGKIVAAGDVRNPYGNVGLVRYQGDNVVQATNVEELYSAVNNPQNAGNPIVIAPGVYMLSATDPNGVARPNSGRLELQDNMSLVGVAGDRTAVVIDAANLPVTSFNNAPPIPSVAAVRIGRGSNSVEWLTVRNAVNGNSNIGTDLVSQIPAIVRIAHVASTNSQRGLDVRNWGAAMAGRALVAEVIDNDFYFNKNGLQGEGFRIASQQGANGATIFATLEGNRSYNNYLGLLVENNRSNSAVSRVFSSGDRFYENGNGALVGAALSANATVANGNTVNFTAYGDTFENNNGFSNFDFGGLFIVGGENTSIANGTSNNTVNVELRSCRFSNNQQVDLEMLGVRSNPVSVGAPGTNNKVKVKLYGSQVPKLVVSDSIPDSPGAQNSVTFTRGTPFDFDGDGRADLAGWRDTNGIWSVTNSSNAAVAPFQFGLSGDRIVPGDYDGDGKSDYAVWRPSTGTWYIQQSSVGFRAFQFGMSTDLPVQGDFDGDGKTDIAVFRPSTGTWYLQQSTAGFAAVQFGTSGDKPVVGDYDGDGKADIAVYRPSDGIWYELRSAFGYNAVQFGVATDKVVPADYDGDGKTDLAVYRDSTGTWYLQQSTAGFAGLQFGIVTDIPAAADYDGDGKADISLYRPSNANWYRINSSNSAFTAIAFGQNGDKPVPSGAIPVQ